MLQAKVTFWRSQIRCYVTIYALCHATLNFRIKMKKIMLITSNLNLESSVNPLQLSKPAKKFTQVETKKKNNNEINGC